MKTRAITGFFFIIVMLGSVLLGKFVFGAFFLLLSALSLHEFYGLVKHASLKPNTTAGIVNGAMVYTGFLLLIYANNHILASPGAGKVAHGLLFLLPIMFSAIFIDELFKQSASPVTNIAFTYLGIIYIIVPFTFFHALAYVGGGFNFHYPLAFLLMLWANDTGAYLVGRQFGKTKLFERHSPKKTWEGFIGGLLISIVAAIIIGHFFADLPWKQWVSVAILIACFGTLGDLVESMFKRSIHVKDSGGLLPGHGGLLDRFDGLLLAAPVVYTYLYFISF
jgi:phosphatidate cytidylyltransferase